MATSGDFSMATDSQAVLLTRYQHVIDSLRIEAAARVGSAIWGEAN